MDTEVEDIEAEVVEEDTVDMGDKEPEVADTVDKGDMAPQKVLARAQAEFPYFLFLYMFFYMPVNISPLELRQENPRQ